jgi:hypothetical protein
MHGVTWAAISTEIHMDAHQWLAGERDSMACALLLRDAIDMSHQWCADYGQASADAAVLVLHSGRQTSTAAVTVHETRARGGLVPARGGAGRGQHHFGLGVLASCVD